MGKIICSEWKKETDSLGSCKLTDIEWLCRKNYAEKHFEGCPFYMIRNKKPPPTEEE